MLRTLLFVVVTSLSSFLYAQDDLLNVKNYLAQHQKELNLTTADFAELKTNRSYVEKSSQIKRTYVSQTVSGIEIEGSIFSLHRNTTTQKEFGSGNLIPVHTLQVDAPTPTKSVDAVVKKVLSTLQIDQTNLALKQSSATPDHKTIFSRSSTAIWDVPARLIYLHDQKTNRLKLVWEVQVYEYNKQHYWLVYVEDKTDKIVRKVDLVLHCSFGGGITDKNLKHNQHPHELAMENYKDEYGQPEPAKQNVTYKGVEALPTNNGYRVYDMPLESPGDNGAAHSLVTNKENAAASPDGWHRVANLISYNHTRGNNVWAFYDPSPSPLGGIPNNATVAYANNGLAGTPPLAEPFVFDHPVDLTKEPAQYRNAAIVNLFYWNNLIHDVFYQFGFNEDAANFQSSHLFSDGQRGSAASLLGQNDEVWAQAQDGGGTNNANFLTLRDGIPGSAQMQMYLWTPSVPDSLVQITSSPGNNPPTGKRFFAVQGSFNTTFPDTNDLYNHPVLNRRFVIVQKNPLAIVGTSSQGCATGQQSIALPPANDVSNKIVLIDRGGCSFIEKVLGAQLGLAAGVIVINSEDGQPAGMGGSDAPGQVINIPAVMISKTDGELLKARLAAGEIIGSLKQNIPIPPMRDGDFDNGVIAHEYGHGISSRLTGGPGSLLPLGGDEQGGEGWSDFIGLYMITRSNDLLPATTTHPNGVLPNKGIGTYVTYRGLGEGGIRPTPYSINTAVNPSVFKDIAKGGEITVPHGVGYIWCTMLYDMEQLLIDQYGFNNDPYLGADPVTAGGAPAAGIGGNNVAMRLVIEGMKLQPLSPTFEQQRDAILAADTLLYGGRHSCKIWEAFSKRGLGYSARSNSNSLGDEQQAFDMPPSCAPDQKRLNIVKKAPEGIPNNSNAVYTVSVTNILETATTNITVSDSIPAGTSFVSASDGGTLVGNNVVWNIASLAGKATKNLTLTLGVSLPDASVSIFHDNHESGTTNWVASTDTDPWQLITTDAYSGTKAWYAREVEDATHNVTLSMANSVAIPGAGAKLSFYHKFSTEQSFDGGVIEVSTDNGSTWTYLPGSAFEKNGYNSIIATLDNPNIGLSDLAAFSGATPGYINSVADLSGYAGEQIRIRFRFTCDVGTLASGTNPGWFVDDVYLIQNLTTITNYANLRLTSNERVFDSTGNTPSANATSIVFENTTLSVRMSTLKAAAQKNHIRLSWKTFEEINNAGFEVERRAENETSFTKVGFVKASGTNSFDKEYLFNDDNIKPDVFYYYRLKQVDLDRKFTYTNTALAKLGLLDNSIVFDIMPNPATSRANLIISTPGRKNGIIKLYDAMGRPVTTLNAGSAFTSLQRYEISVANLPAGTYWLELTVDNLKITRSLIITK